MSLIITKTSGVLSVKDGTSNPKYFFGAVGSYQASDANDTILITITEPNSTPMQYTVAYGDLTVGASTATTMSSALVLLNAIFGS